MREVQCRDGSDPPTEQLTKQTSHLEVTHKLPPACTNYHSTSSLTGIPPTIGLTLRAAPSHLHVTLSHPCLTLPHPPACAAPLRKTVPVQLCNRCSCNPGAQVQAVHVLWHTEHGSELRLDCREMAIESATTPCLSGTTLRHTQGLILWHTKHGNRATAGLWGNGSLATSCNPHAKHHLGSKR